MKCQICNKELMSLKALAVHINNEHNEITKEEYYIKYISIENEHLCPICGNKNTFKGMTKKFSKYCSTKCLNRDPKTKEKIKNTNLKKYGTSTPLQNKEIKENIKKSNLEKFGVENVFQNKEIQNKINKTIKNKFNVNNVSQSIDIQKKKKDTLLKNFGVEHQMYSDEIKNKVVQKTQKTNLINFFEKLFKSDRLKNRCIPLFDLNEYTGINKLYKFQCTKCNMEFFDNIISGKIPRCSFCYPIKVGVSLMENEIYNYIKTVIPTDEIIIQSDRTIISPLELDIFIPSRNCAIELDGLYWHSEISGKKDNKYHFTKTRLCREKNIQLFHIFEDEWINKQEIVKSMINNRLKVNSIKTYARESKIKEVSSKDTRNFLNDNHIQGSVPSSIRLGLYKDDELVCIFTAGKSRYTNIEEFELLRFCSKLNTNVVGGFSKLLKYFTKKYSNKLITYADLRYGDGNVYLNNGFNFIKTNSPNYFYMNDYLNRYSREKYQKHKLEKLLSNFDSNLTEWENMQLNGYDRIWDCGNIMYSLY